MSAAIKRLSTIIRPSNASTPPSPPKESAKNSIDAPAPAAPVDAATADAAPKAEEKPNGVPTDAVKDTADSAAPEQSPPAAPVATEDVKEAPSAADASKDKEATAPSSVESKEKEGKATHRRDPRDIGRSTIRRFSTILRSQAKDAHKDKEPAPPLPSQEDAVKPEDGETKAPATDETPKETAPKENGIVDSAPVSKNAKAAKSAPKGEAKVGKRRSASFFTAAREGLQRTAKDVQTRARGQPGAAKAKAAPKVEAVPKILKKGAAKGKRVVVITGASKGIGLEFVKQFANQPNTFVIALSRTAEKSAALKPIVNASAKEGHHVRAIKLDVSSSRSIHNVVKDIVELTDGRLDLLINAAGSRGNPALKVWDLKGSDLEDELRTNLIGPIAFTNALIPYLKPMPPKEETKEKEKEVEKVEQSDVKDEKADEKVEGKAEEKVEEITEAKEDKAEEAEEKKEDAAEGVKAETVEPAAAAEEEPVATEAKTDSQEPAAAAAAAASTAEPAAEPPTTAADKQEEPAAAEAPVEKPSEAVPAVEGEPAGPASVEAPSVLPEQPFVIFLAPSDPIQNVEGTVPTGSTFAPSPRTLFSLSRAALQVAIAKYAVGLAGKGIGIVGMERHELLDPHSAVSDEESAAAVIKALPDLNIRDNGKLMRTSA